MAETIGGGGILIEGQTWKPDGLDRRAILFSREAALVVLELLREWAAVEAAKEKA